MKLITKAIAESIPSLYATDGQARRKVVAKFFTPWSSWTWYVVEGEQHGTDWRLYGYVDSGQEKEWGYFMLSELESVRGPVGLTIERDLYFDGKTIDLAGNIH